MTKSVADLKIKIFADGANLNEMLEMHSKPHIKGLTTNPTLMRKAGISNYREFAQQALVHVTDKPISFEVFDNLDEMKKQGLEIASWGANVFVKIPITNTLGESTFPVVKYLTAQGVKVNITAIMTTKQVKEIASALNPSVPNYISVFAGRIADTGIDPRYTVSESLEIMSKVSSVSEVIWASPRELLNIFQAEEIGCQIITATNDILQKLELLGKDLQAYSLETVMMFRKDAVASGFEL
jgi:transaldolase